MDWSDEGIVLGARRHGEGAAIVTLLTREHGRHAGLVRGGSGRRARGVYQIGNRVAATWRARLAEHLGSYTCELLRADAATLLAEKLPLLALTSAAALLDSALPERAPHEDMFEDFASLIAALEQPGWQIGYARWELALLAALGFGLDLGECAVSGATEGLTYVSPRTGRAVSEGAAAQWRDRLLPLPDFLRQDTDFSATPSEVLDALRLTGHFLESHVFASEGRALPESRARLIEGLASAVPNSSSDNE